MIHDEGIERAIDWMDGIAKTAEDRMISIAIINGLRELQEARKKEKWLRGLLKKSQDAGKALRDSLTEVEWKQE